MNAAEQPLPLSARRERARATERHTEYLARSYACRDMAMHAFDPFDAQFLRAMTMVWQLLADRNAGVPHTLGPKVPL